MGKATLYAYFKEQGMNDFGVSGLMANIQAESSFVSCNLQSNGNTKLKMTDAEYTKAVDNGEYSRETFCKDGYGYGLVQWTYHTRKAALYDFMKKAKVSIGDEQKQAEYIVKEIKGYKSVWKILCNAKSVREASDAVMLQYERPANQSESARAKRAGYGETIYNEFCTTAKKEPVKVTQSTSKPKVNVDEFISYIKSTVGNAYLWGGQGETLYSLIEKLAEQKGQSEDKTTQMLTFLKSKGIKDISFFDCSGLAVDFLLKKKVITSDMTADMLYKKCDKITRTDAKAGDWVFLGDASKKTHIGYMIDKNTVVHAYNQAQGVISEPVSKNTKWYFGRPNFCIDFGSTAPSADVVILDKYTPAYNTAKDAENGTKKVALYSPGEYFIYKKYGKAINITKKKGAPGAWVVI